MVITGASSGLGAALARAYAARGADLTLCGRNIERLETTASDCRVSSGGAARVDIEVLDVTDASSMQKRMTAIDTSRPIDTIFANAGVGGSMVVVERPGERADVADAIVATNFTGVLNTVIPVLPGMMRRGRGHVVLVSSLAAFGGLAQSPVYSASKAAVRLYGEGLRRMLHGSGVGVTVVSPGFVDTPMSRSLPVQPPGVWGVDKAAAAVIAGVDRGKAEIAFPRYLKHLMQFGSLLPAGLSDGLFRLAARTAKPRAEGNS